MARSTFKVLFYVNGSKEKDGIVPIMGRVTINGTVAQFSCKQTIPKTLWDAKGNRAKGKSTEARDINLALDNIKAQIIKHYQRISDREAYVTAEMVRNAYQGIGSEYETLIKAFDKDCANFLKRVGKDRSIGTYKVMVRARNYVAAFIKSFYKRTDMSMLELTPDFIKEFAAYLTAERGLKNATIWLNCMWLKGAATTAATNIAESVGSLFGSNKVKTLERENSALQNRISELENEAQQREERQAKQVQEVKNAYEQQNRRLSEFVDFVKRYFPYVERLMPVINFLRDRLGFNDEIIRRLCEFKEVGIKGKLYSSEFNQSFDTRHSVCSIKQDESGKFDFKIDGVSHVSWFRRKKDEFMEALGMPIKKQNRDIKL
ncbi:phage integrase SAM-like domain-containing protein [Parabacteroides chinchillae]|uniref:Phage integrase SAM-like domain-containing protein n=1 Tax=Parabacteroides chinchillae TaxID=871327 RepID=A0A8G2F1T2_9BACT|nr:phage integrase SAM-like domain-containing protein [Parabacteroides chinchillae]SEG01132.1 Phage integrase SAM-like domain-containing protein [Parabacteroides chinchillae]